jgi:hypothetical protein
MLDEDMASTPEVLSHLKLLIITEPNVPEETMHAVSQVRKTPSWPRSWAKFSLL